VTTTARTVLDEVFGQGFVEHPDGRRLPVGANISQANSDALTRFVASRRPSMVIEIGMAYGVSTLSILMGLEQTPEARLISIDPYVGWPTGLVVAQHQITRAGLAAQHSHINDFSHLALPRILDSGVRPELIYIDGDHSFDAVFVDFFYADKLLAEGGVVAFNDVGWRSVHRVIKHISKARAYRELDVGLPRIFNARNPAYSLIRRIEGRSTYDRYFTKLGVSNP
jgi:predicted O-methyltransferase YrrM